MMMPIVLSALPYYSVLDLFREDGEYARKKAAWRLIETRINRICKRIQANARALHATSGHRQERHRQQIHRLRSHLRKLGTDIMAPMTWPVKGEPTTPVYKKGDD